MPRREAAARSVPEDAARKSPCRPNQRRRSGGSRRPGDTSRIWRDWRNWRPRSRTTGWLLKCGRRCRSTSMRAPRGWISPTVDVSGIHQISVSSGPYSTAAESPQGAVPAAQDRHGRVHQRNRGESTRCPMGAVQHRRDPPPLGEPQITILTRRSFRPRSASCISRTPCWNSVPPSTTRWTRRGIR